MKAEPFIEDLGFGEGMRWHDGRLWYSDFFLHRISSAAPDGSVRLEVEIADQPSGLGWLPDGRLLFVAMKTQKVMRREADGSLAVHADLSGLARFHTNDMLVTANGTAFVGCFGYDLDAYMTENGAPVLFSEPGPPKAPLMRVPPDGKATIASDGHRFPNGMALLDGGRTLIVAETFKPCLTAFDLSDDGTLSNRRVWAELPQTIAPDGISADSDGAIWCANAFSPDCVRIGQGGEILERVETSMNAFCCALGGSDGRTLFVATAEADPETKAVCGMIEIATVKSPPRAGRLASHQLALPNCNLYTRRS
ncbi:MAG TPA: SMP-30/gluconolactonase/LRE family protein [Rhizomicrobium sp.]